MWTVPFSGNTVSFPIVQTSEVDDSASSFSERSSIASETEFGTSFDSVSEAEMNSEAIPSPPRLKKAKVKRAVGSIAEEEKKQKPQYHDSFTYRMGLAEELPPLSSNREIFADLTKRALGHGFESKVASRMKSKLRVATMCSGTESPLLALTLIQTCKPPVLFYVNH